jgi:hypothetical protein
MIFKRWERRHCADPLETRLYKGGGGGSSASLSTTTINQDSRAVLQDAVQVGQGATATINMSSADAEVLKSLGGNLSDAVTALGQMSATTLRDVGGSIVDLNKDSISANSKAWDSTLQFGANVVDKMIDQMSEGYALAGKAVDNFTPTENKNADIGKYAMLAAAAVAMAVLLKGTK